MVIATFNNGKIDADLSTRSLLVRLHAEERFTPNVNCEAYAKAHADEIYGELLTIALSPPVPKLIDIGTGFRFDDWVDATCRRFPATAYNLGAADTLEDQYQELFAYGEDNLDDAQPAGVYAEILKNADHYPAWAEALKHRKNARARETVLGIYLKQRTGQVYNGVRLDYVDGEPRTYKFTRIA